jgi:hypothetical protein
MALSPREKVLILIPVALGAALGFYSYIHQPLMARRAEVEAQLEMVARDLKQGQKQLAQEGDLEARRQAVAAREQVVDSAVPGKNAASLFVWYLSQAEMRSGGRVRGIKVAERKTIDPANPKANAAPQGCTSGSTGASSSGTNSGAATDSGASNGGATNSGTTNGGTSGDATNGNAGSNGNPGVNSGSAGKAGNAACTDSAQFAPGAILVVTMELKLSAKFSEHLHFTQMLEEMPLFLGNDRVELVRTQAPDWQKAAQLVGEGMTARAANLLSESPQVEGSYTLLLYFKNGKQGPATSEMSFTSEPGRKDPFATTGINEFTKYVEDAFSGRVLVPDPSNPQQLIPEPEQLG